MYWPIRCLTCAMRRETRLQLTTIGETRSRQRSRRAVKPHPTIKSQPSSLCVRLGIPPPLSVARTTPPGTPWSKPTSCHRSTGVSPVGTKGILPVEHRQASRVLYIFLRVLLVVAQMHRLPFQSLSTREARMNGNTSVVCRRQQETLGSCSALVLQLMQA